MNGVYTQLFLYEIKLKKHFSWEANIRSKLLVYSSTEERLNWANGFKWFMEAM